MKQVVTTTLTIEDKVFTNESGERVEYTAVTAKVADTDIRLDIRKEDKSLFKYLVKQAQSEVK